MCNIKDVRFSMCSECGEMTVPIFKIIQRTKQVCKCLKCGSITKRRFMKDGNIKSDWYYDCQIGRKGYNKIKELILEVAVNEDGECIEIINKLRRSKNEK